MELGVGVWLLHQAPDLPLPLSGTGKMQRVRRYQRFAARCLEQARILQLIPASRPFWPKWLWNGKDSPKRLKARKWNKTFKVPRKTPATSGLATTRIRSADQKRLLARPRSKAAKSEMVV
jgi:hypothetical protein